MTLFKYKYRTESNRLQNWDYSSEAIYFLTLVTHNREFIFGEILNKKMVLNDLGRIIETEIYNSVTIRDKWIFHNWVIMPNHIHLLIEIKEEIEIENYFLKNRNTNTGDAVKMHCSASLRADETNLDAMNECDIEKRHCSASLRVDESAKNPKFSRKPKSISSFVGQFKSVTTKKMNVMNATEREIIWQLNYHDHIVRNFESFRNIFYYIKNNPKKWDQDSLKD